MKTTSFNINRNAYLFFIAIILIFSQGCSASTFTPPTPTQTPSLSLTSTPHQANFTPTAVFPTSTFPVPTVTQSSPTATPLIPMKLAGELVRLNLGAVEQIVLSSSGNWLVAVGATHICKFDTSIFNQNWCTLSALPAEYEEWVSLKNSYENLVSKIAFQPEDNQIVYALWYGAIIFLDGTSGQRIHVIDDYLQSNIKDLVWSHDNDHLIVWSSKFGVDIWNIKTEKKDGRLEIDPTQIQSAAWTPDGNMAAFKLKDSGMISMWDITTLKQIGSVDTMLPDYGFKLALSPDGSIIYASVYTLMGACGMDQGDQGWIKAWDTATSELIFDTDMEGTCLQSMSISPDGRELAGITGYGKLKILGTYSGNIVFDPPYNFFKSMLWWGSDRFLFVHYPANPYGITDFKSIGALDLDTKWITPIYLPGFGNIYSLAWLPDGEGLVTNSVGGTLSIWEASTGKRMEQFRVALEGTSLTNFGPASISPSDGTLAAPALKSVALIDLRSQQVVKMMEYDSAWPDTHAAYTTWSADGKKVAALEFDADSEVVVWDAATGKATFTLPFERSTIIWDLAISPDGSKLAISEFLGGEYRFVVWDIEAKKEIATIKTTDSINEVTWINQNQAVVTSHGWINIYDLISGTKLRTVAQGGYHIAISTDISLVAVPKDWGTLVLYDFNSGDTLAHLSLEPVSINSLVISPDGKMLAALTEFGSVIIWDISQYY